MSSKDLPADLAVTSLCMAFDGIHDPQICPNTNLKALNEIHSFTMTPMAHPTQVTVSEMVDRLKAKFKFSLPATSNF